MGEISSLQVRIASHFDLICVKQLDASLPTAVDSIAQMSVLVQCLVACIQNEVAQGVICLSRYLLGSIVEPNGE